MKRIDLGSSGIIYLMDVGEKPDNQTWAEFIEEARKAFTSEPCSVLAPVSRFFKPMAIASGNMRVESQIEVSFPVENPGAVDILYTVWSGEIGKPLDKVKVGGFTLTGITSLDDRLRGIELQIVADMEKKLEEYTRITSEARKVLENRGYKQLP